MWLQRLRCREIRHCEPWHGHRPGLRRLQQWNVLDWEERSKLQATHDLRCREVCHRATHISS
jgi:hypothetical protein